MSTGGRRALRGYVSRHRRVLAAEIPPRSCIFPVLYTKPSIVRRCHTPSASGLLSPSQGGAAGATRKNAPSAGNAPLALYEEWQDGPGLSYTRRPQPEKQ